MHVPLDAKVCLVAYQNHILKVYVIILLILNTPLSIYIYASQQNETLSWVNLLHCKLIAVRRRLADAFDNGKTYNQGLYLPYDGKVAMTIDGAEFVSSLVFLLIKLLDTSF